MGLLDQIVEGMTGQAGGSASVLPAALKLLLGGTQQGGLAGMVQQFESAGLGNVVNSWISNGPNQSISPQDLHRALGEDQVQQASAQTGLSVAQLLPLLAQHLPDIINQLTPHGTLPQGEPQNIRT